jgi:DNA-binding transcriptional LysR family regulator
VELRQLEAFVAVAEERNFTRAAARLHLAQSGLSATIRTLERELRAPLFVRTTRQVELTAAGDALLGEARRTLASARSAAESVAAVEGLKQGKVTLGIMQASSFIDLAGILRRYRATYPGIELKLHQAPGDLLTRQLHEHQADLIFIMQQDEPGPQILSHPMLRSPTVILCRTDHPLAGKATVDLRAVAEYSLVSYPPGWGVRELTDRALHSIGVSPHYDFEVNDTATLLDLVQAGLGIAVVPEAMAMRRPGLHRATIKGRRHLWTIAAQTLAPNPTNPAAQALWTMLTDLNGSEPDNRPAA